MAGPSTTDTAPLPNPGATAEWRAAVERAVRAHGTPCYVTRARPILSALAVIEHGHSGPVRQWLSVKTHPLGALVAWWARSGRGVEVVSETELIAALDAGCPPSSLLVNGLAKHRWLPRHPIRGLRVHFDSSTEIEALLDCAIRAEWRVGVRLHAPDERDARDGRFAGQFGMTADEGAAALRRLLAAGANVESVHFHLGQRPQAAGAYQRAVAHAATVCAAAGFRPRYVDCGGGLPSREGADQTLTDVRAAVDAAFAMFAPEIEEVWLEHGRFLLEDAAVLAISVLDIKDRPDARYLICDGGRTNHALAADHGLHPLWMLPERTGRGTLTTICGPTCMTDDILGRAPLPDDIAPGDVLVWTAAGAYHLPWETRFSHGLCAAVWYDERETLSLARQREQPREWVTG
jgi:ornithine decarboxylase